MTIKQALKSRTVQYGVALAVLSVLAKEQQDTDNHYNVVTK